MKLKSAYLPYFLIAALLFSSSIFFIRSVQGQEESVRLAKDAYQKIIGSLETEERVKLCVDEELQYERIERSLLSAWRQAWVSKNTADFAALFLDGLPRGGIAARAVKPWRELDGIAEFKWAGDAAVSWDDYLNGYTEISDVTLTTDATYPQEKEQPATITLKIRFDIRGFQKEGTAVVRRTDRGFFLATVVQVGSTWKLSDIQTLSGETLTSRRSPGFQEVTKDVGLDSVPTYLRTEAIRRGGYALAVGDLLGDGSKLVFVGARDEASIWKLGADGKFTQQLQYPFTKDTLVKTGIFADFENTGRRDLLSVRFTPDAQGSDIELYKNDGKNVFTRAKDFILNRWQSDYAMPASVADFNNDGKLDFYVGFPGEKDFTTLETGGIVQPGQAMQGVFLNTSPYVFTDVSKESGIDYQWHHDTRQTYAHSSMAVDVDRDGVQDIIVIDDRGNLGPVYKNLGGGKFAEMGERIGLGFNSLGMGVATADVRGVGRSDYVMSYVNFAAANRLMNSCVSTAGGNSTEILQGIAGGGLRYFLDIGMGTFVDATTRVGLDWAGEGVAGLEFIDYNNDGHPDLFVSNGLWSGTSREQDVSGLFVSAVLNGENRNKITGLSLSNNPRLYMNFLSNFRGDISSGVYAEDGPRPSMAGYQHKRLFRNNGDGTFTEVGFLEGVDSIADGYIAARADINDDGKMDLVLRNGDPGTNEYTFPVVQVYKNTSANSNGLFISVRGNPEKGSNRDGIGTQVTVEVGGEKHYQELIANNGPSQSERVLHFGLGSHTKADRITVRFPSGRTQAYHNVPAGEFLAEEN